MYVNKIPKNARGKSIGIKAPQVKETNTKVVIYAYLLWALNSGP